MKYYRLKEKALSEGVQSWKEQVVETRLGTADSNTVAFAIACLCHVSYSDAPYRYRMFCRARVCAGCDRSDSYIGHLVLVIRKIHVRLLYQAACVGLIISLTVAINGNSAFTSSLYSIIFLSIFVRLFLPARSGSVCERLGGLYASLA